MWHKEGELEKSATVKESLTVQNEGGTDEPMTLYKNFRGAEPKIEPLLKRRGLK
ncbi:MAG: hypothetical protein WCR42_05355 [bacterium]